MALNKKKKKTAPSKKKSPPAKAKTPKKKAVAKKAASKKAQPASKKTAPKKAKPKAAKPKKIAVKTAAKKTKTSGKTKNASPQIRRMASGANGYVPAHLKVAGAANPRPMAEEVPFSPLYDHLLIQPEGESDRTPGGLFIPAMAQDKPLRGRIVAVGTGGLNKKGRLRPLDVTVGERVLFGPYAGSKITLGAADFLILKENEILGVIEE